MKIKIFLVWSIIPESTSFYVFDATEEIMSWLKLCHNQFVNMETGDQSIDDALVKLNDFLSSLTAIDSKPPFGLTGKFLVINSGFVL